MANQIAVVVTVPDAFKSYSNHYDVLKAAVQKYVDGHDWEAEPTRPPRPAPPKTIKLPLTDHGLGGPSSYVVA